MTDPIRISEIFNSLDTVCPKLSPIARKLALAALFSTAPAVQQLSILPLRAGTLVEIRSGRLFVCCAPPEQPPFDEQEMDGCWLIFRASSHGASSAKAVTDLRLLAGELQSQSGQAISPPLEDFHFFAPLQEHLHEVAGLNARLADQLRFVISLREHFPEELFGDEIHSDTPMVVFAETHNSLRLDLVLAHDPPPPEATEIKAAGERFDGPVRFVVLGRNLTYKPSPLVRIPSSVRLRTRPDEPERPRAQHGL